MTKPSHTYYTMHQEAFMTCEFVHFLHLHEFICVHFAYEIERKTKVIEYIIDEHSVRACVLYLHLRAKRNFEILKFHFLHFKFPKSKCDKMH